MNSIASCVERYITRPARKNDDLIENSHVTFEEFQALIDQGAMSFYWNRVMEEGRQERYGFRKSLPKIFLNILSGNNALYNNPESIQPENVLGTNTLWIGIYAEESVREERLIRRSPDLVRDKPEEVSYRLRDLAEFMKPYVHIVVNNFGDNERNAPLNFLQLVQEVYNYENNNSR